MDEICRQQNSLAASLKQENDSYAELEKAYNLDHMISTAKENHEKLVNIKRSLLLIKDKTTRLKKRATKMLEDKNRDDLEKQRSRERREMLERHLEPVVNTKRDQ